MKHLLTALLFFAIISCRKTDTGWEINTNNHMLTFGVPYGKDTIWGTIGDSTIEVVIPDTSLRVCAPVFTHEGIAVLIRDSAQVSGHSVHDFSHSSIYLVSNLQGDYLPYKVFFTYFHKLPIWYINTSGVEISDKENYVPGNITLDGNGDSVVNYTMGIRGRGNSTWSYPWIPKLAYKIKFDDKQKVFGFPSDKEWAILANYFDNAVGLRNDVYFEISNIVQREWTPRRKFVDVFLNSKYNGLYLLTETIKSGKDRANIDLKNGGWLVEVTHSGADDPFSFRDGNIPGDYKEGSIPKEEVQAQLDSFVNKLYTGGDYQSLFDLDSFVSWFIVNELSKNQDAFFWSSVYLQRDNATSKIKMGPCWDGDLSAGNSLGEGTIQPTGWRLENAEVAGYIFQDPALKAALKIKWNQYKDKLFGIASYINKQAAYIKDAALANVSLQFFPGTNFQGEVDLLRQWYDTRLKWMDAEINK